MSAPDELTVKAPASISGQIAKLEERGCVINDREFAHKTLETVNYYRLVNYFAVFSEDKGHYKEGTLFEDGIRLYDFDRRLRAELLVLLEEIEISARAAVSNYHASKYGATGYLNADSFDRGHNHRAFITKIERMIDKNANLTFVKHHNSKYGGAFPLWVIMELFSFGALAFFYQDLKIGDRKEIAKYYFGIDSRLAENWLEKLADLRNHCAHYNRVYGDPLDFNGGLRPIEIDTPREYEMKSTLFDFVLTMKFLHKRARSWENSFIAALERLFDEYDDVTDPDVLGFPDDWRDFLL